MRHILFRLIDFSELRVNSFEVLLDEFSIIILSVFDIDPLAAAQDRIAIFSGMLRELSGLGFLETFVPQWVTKKM